MKKFNHNLFATTIATTSQRQQQCLNQGTRLVLQHDCPKHTSATVDFPQFPKLPIELRQKIWLCTLTPRTVGIRCFFPENTSGMEHVPQGMHDDVSLWRLNFSSTAVLPTAFRVCNSSRSAVIPFYPLCFASRTPGASTHFNFELDTLYIGDITSELLFRFFDGMSLNERQTPRRLSLCETLGFCGWADEEGLSVTDIMECYHLKEVDGGEVCDKRLQLKTWATFRDYLDRFTCLKEFILVQNIYYKLGYAKGRYELYHLIPNSFKRGYYPSAENQVTFFDEFPDELLARPELRIFVKPEKKLVWYWDGFESFAGRKVNIVYGSNRGLLAE